MGQKPVFLEKPGFSTNCAGPSPYCPLTMNAYGLWFVRFM
jgi:hypothetical protein